MARYAEGTTVSSDTSRAEIERTLRRYGAGEFLFGYSDTEAVVGFLAHNRQVRFRLTLPSFGAFSHTPERQLRRSPAQQQAAYEQAVRQRWRALALVIKAKLEAVESNIVNFDEEFLAHIVMPNNRTVGQEVLPRMQEAIATGAMPALLPGNVDA
jgi:hypothetical protein